MKFIVLLRHGIAEDKAPGQNDADRELTAEGRKKMKDVARALAEIFPDAEAIYSSPYVRAVQTAEAVAKAYDDRFSVRTTDSLKPGAAARDFRKFLDSLKGDFAIFAGHEPNMSAIMVDLTGIHGSEFSLKKGGFYGVRFEVGVATLEWMVPPRVVRAG